MSKTYRRNRSDPYGKARKASKRKRNLRKSKRG